MNKSPREIAALMTQDQRQRASSDFGDALDIVDELCGGLSYSALFNVTCAVLEIIEGRRL